MYNDLILKKNSLEKNHSPREWILREWQEKRRNNKEMLKQNLRYSIKHCQSKLPLLSEKLHYLFDDVTQKKNLSSKN